MNLTVSRQYQTLAPNLGKQNSQFFSQGIFSCEGAAQHLHLSLCLSVCLWSNLIFSLFTPVSDIF